MDTSFTQLFFDAAQTMGSVALNIPASSSGSLSTWNSLAMRLGDTNPSGFGGAVDNILVTTAAVPEPSALSFLGLAGLAAWGLIRHKRQSGIA